MKTSSVVLAAQGGNSTGSVLDRITTQNPTVEEFRQPFVRDALANEFDDDDRRREQRLHLLVGLIVAQGAQGVMRYYKRRNVAIVRFGLAQSNLGEPQPLSAELLSAKWRGLNRRGHQQVSEWACQIVAQRTGAIPASIDLIIVLDAQLTSTLLHDLLLQQACSLGFGADLNHFLWRLENYLIGGDRRDDVDVPISTRLNLRSRTCPRAFQGARDQLVSGETVAR